MYEHWGHALINILHVPIGMYEHWGCSYICSYDCVLNSPMTPVFSYGTQASIYSYQVNKIHWPIFTKRGACLTLILLLAWLLKFIQHGLLLHCAAWHSKTDDFQEWETPKEVWSQTDWWGLSHFQPLSVSTSIRSQRPHCYVLTPHQFHLTVRWDEELIELAQTWTPKENSELVVDIW